MHFKASLCSGLTCPLPLDILPGGEVAGLELLLEVLELAGVLLHLVVTHPHSEAAAQRDPP